MDRTFCFHMSGVDDSGGMIMGMHFDEKCGHALDMCLGKEEKMTIYCISLMKESSLVDEMRWLNIQDVHNIPTVKIYYPQGRVVDNSLKHHSIFTINLYFLLSPSSNHLLY